MKNASGFSRLWIVNRLIRRDSATTEMCEYFFTFVKYELCEWFFTPLNCEKTTATNTSVI